MVRLRYQRPLPALERSGLVKWWHLWEKSPSFSIFIIEMEIRSSFCYKNTSPLKLTLAEELVKKQQWAKFEEVDKINSFTYNSIISQGGISSGYSNSTNSPIFYTFQSHKEISDYSAGQRAHIFEYPDISGFVIPYAQRTYPIIGQDISGQDISGHPSCPKADVSKIQSAKRLLFNTKDLTLYNQVSTFNAKFPRSPYKFQSNTDYITYSKIKKLICNTG